MIIALHRENRSVHREASRFTSCFCAQRFGRPILSAALYRVDGGLPRRRECWRMFGAVAAIAPQRGDRELDFSAEVDIDTRDAVAAKASALREQARPDPT